LRFADDDAHALIDILGPSAGSDRSYSKIHTRLLVDEDATSQAILSALRELDRAVGKEELGEITGYPAGSSSLKNGLSKLRILGVITGRSEVMLSAELRQK
jgi:hypothetical protein